MSVPASRRVLRPSLHGLWPMIAVNVVLGLPAYFIAFVLSYGFRNEVGWGQHASFLILIATFAATAGLIGAFLARTPRPRTPMTRRATFAVTMSLALNLAVVGAGSIVSAAHKDENSVSAGFSPLTDVLLATGLFVTAVALAAAALYVDLRWRDGDGA